MTLFDAILSRPEFQAQPPLLVDIGASGSLPAVWRPIARHCVCLAFDPDEREMSHADKPSGFKRLIVVPKALTEKRATSLSFVLTESPYCSSLLEPDDRALADWSFAPLFKVVGRRRFKAARLPELLKELKLGAVDWFKTDSQGTDLRLFKSLSPAAQRRVLVAEFEPGILDAYRGEDKLWQVMAHMEKLPFWVSSLQPRGPQRIPAALIGAPQGLGKRAVQGLAPAVGWAEIHYFNDAKGPGLGLRECLLAWVFASLKGQHGFALSLALRGSVRFKDPLFGRLAAASRASAGAALLRALPRLALGKLAHGWGRA